MNIVSTNLGNIVITIQSFVFGIKNYIILIKVGVANTTLVFEKVYAPFASFVLRMYKTIILQNGIYIFLPQPCAIKKDTAYLIISFTILQFFYPKYLQTKTPQRAIICIKWMTFHTKILVYDSVTIILIVGWRLFYNQFYISYGFLINIKNGLAIFPFFHILYGMAYQFCHSVVITILTS